MNRISSWAARRERADHGAARRPGGHLDPGNDAATGRVRVIASSRSAAIPSATANRAA